MDYVCGLLFHPQHKSVALIEKIKPEYQRGFLNGIGGKIEQFEPPEQAMKREFLEEAGVSIHETQWKLFRVEVFRNMAPDGSEGARVFWFAATATPRQWDEVRTMEEEVVVKWSGDITSDKLMYNLKYLLPMAEVLLGMPPEKFPEP